MKDKIKKTSKKYLVLPIAALGMIAVLSLSSADAVSARGRTGNRSEFASAIAQKFGLDQTAVEETMQEFHQVRMEERHQEREAKFEERMEAAVAAGGLTEAQMFAVMEKHEEMHQRMQELHDQDLSPEDMREMKAEMHEEMQTWAESQGIDLESFMQFRGKMRGEGKGIGYGRGFGLHN